MKKILLLLSLAFITGSMASTLATRNLFPASCITTDRNITCTIDTLDNKITLQIVKSDLIQEFALTGIFETSFEALDLPGIAVNVKYDFDQVTKTITVSNHTNGELIGVFAGEEGAAQPIKHDNLPGFFSVDKPFNWETACTIISENKVECTVNSKPKMDFIMVSTNPITNFTFNGKMISYLTPNQLLGNQYNTKYEFDPTAQKTKITIMSNPYAAAAIVEGVGEVSPTQLEILLSEFFINSK